MNHFQLYARPWWVNLLILIPILAFWILKYKRVNLSFKRLVYLGLFGISFGFVEAVAVVYLRAVLGLLPGLNESFQKIWFYAGNYQQLSALARLPNSLGVIELIREFATLIMLVSIACVAGSKLRERFAFFLWSFAFWDLFYYVFLWLLVRWPQSLITNDVLFLIPKPWYSQVWFPILIDLITIAVIISAAKRRADFQF